MNNFIDYFYNIKVNNITKKKQYYMFIFNNYIYKLYVYDGNDNTNYLVNINRQMLGRTLISEIILNKDGNAISVYNNTKYILIKVYASQVKTISLEDIAFLSNSLEIDKLEINWGLLWSKKIDYLEELINQNGKRYPIIVNSFNYFVGMAENAISYFNSINIENNYKFFISHKIIRFNDKSDALYNPLNIIFDYKVRDVAEYIKNAFFLNNKDIFSELTLYLSYNNLSLTDVKLLISRILYPSFYFNLYDDILIDGKSEKIIIPFIDKMPKYEKYISTIINFFRQWYNIDDILWLARL